MRARAEYCVLGAGVTGLAAGLASGVPVYEAEAVPGGVCRSYYVKAGRARPRSSAPGDRGAYRFEIGGGHWIFGGNASVLRFIRARTPLKSYQRRSAVYFARDGLVIPYPLQNHLQLLGGETAAKALQEIIHARPGPVMTLADWLQASFGATLTNLFFGPFHELYTAGLWTSIAPQDSYKSPVDLALVIKGAFAATEEVGYNASFLYPAAGLDALVMRLARHCEVRYEKQVARVNPRHKELEFTDGSGIRYSLLISTLPLRTMLALADLALDEPPGPSTSLLVLNVGAVKGSQCPDHHWVYVPHSQSGFPFNEAACIQAVCREWLEAIERLPSAKLLVVDDGSTDGTSVLLDELAAQHSSLVVQHQANGGHGRAIRQGYLAALRMGCEWVFQADSDGQFRAADFLSLWEARGRSHFILGCRKDRKDQLLRRWLSRFHDLLIWLGYGVRIRDPNIPFRLMQARLLGALLELVPEGVFAPNVFLAILARKCGQDLCQVPVGHLPRSTGRTSIRTGQLAWLALRCAKELLLFRMTYSRGLEKVLSARARWPMT